MVPSTPDADPGKDGTTMAKESFTALIGRMDRTAEASGDARGWWSAVSLCLPIWEDVKRGWFPAPRFDPRFNEGLAELSSAYQKFGRDLVSAAEARAGIWEYDAETSEIFCDA